MQVVAEAEAETQTEAAAGLEEQRPFEQIVAVARAHENNRTRLVNMLEEVDSMFEEVSELMGDVSDLMRRANELREDTLPALDAEPTPDAVETSNNPTPPTALLEEQQEVEQAPVPTDSPRNASVSSRHSASDMSLDSPGSDGRLSSRHSGSDMSMDSRGSEGRFSVKLIFGIPNIFYPILITINYQMTLIWRPCPAG